MLKSITIENFFSFGEPTKIELNPGVNVLVGINGSGKSNFIKALQLLSLAATNIKSTESLFMQKWGGFGAVANFNVKKKELIRIVYEFVPTIPYLLVDNNLFLELQIQPQGQQQISIEKRFSENLDDFKKPESPEDDYWNHKKDLSSQIAELVHLYNNYNCNISLSELRQAQPNLIEIYVLSDMENLASLLSRIKRDHPLSYEKIEDSIKKINPHFKDIDFDFYGTRIYMVLREKNLARTVPLEHISDGTLRFLVLLSIFLNPLRGTLVSIDEPELGLHPDMIFSVAQMIKDAANKRQNSLDPTQIIISTHSPLLLNQFDIEDILVFEKDNQNQTIVSTKSEEDFPDWNENFLAGQLWLQGELGGKRW